MRRVIAVLCIVVGAVPLLLGTAGAALVGPDDRVDLRPLEPPADVRAVVLPHDLVPLTGVTLHVEARADRGDVLVGSAHPVDVVSYTGGARRLVALRMGTDGRLSGDVRGTPDAPPLDVAAATFWTSQDRGGGTRSLDVPLTDEPVALVAVAADPDARLQVGVGLEVMGAFVVTAGVAVAGALLVGVGAVLLRRRPRGPSVSGPVTVPSPTVVAGHDVAAAPVDARLRVRRRAAVAVTVAGAATLAGCAPVPGLADRPARPERPALTAAEIAAPEPTPDPYQEASDAAAAGDPSAWGRVLSGPRLEASELSTRIELARAARYGTPVDSTTYEVDTLEEIVPRFASYPLYRLELVRKHGDDAAVPVARLWERRDVLDTWHIRASTTVPTGTTLGVGEAQAPHALTTADLSRATDALDAVQHYLTTGDGAGIADLGDLAGVRHELLPVDELGAVVQSLTVEPWGDRDDPFSPAGASRAFAVADGTVAVLAVDVGATLSAADADDRLQITDPVVAELVGQPGWRTSLRTDHVVVVAVAVSAAGDVRVLGADAGSVHGP